MDDDDDRMESSYAQVQREEFISKKLGKFLLPALCLSRPSLTCSNLVQVYKRIWRTCAKRRCINSVRWSRNAANDSTTKMTRATARRHAHSLVSQSVAHGFRHTNFPIYLTDSE